MKSFLIGLATFILVFGVLYSSPSSRNHRYEDNPKLESELDNLYYMLNHITDDQFYVRDNKMMEIIDGSPRTVEFTNTNIELDTGFKIDFDGGSDNTYISALNSTSMGIEVNGGTILTLENNNIVSAGFIRPSVDDDSGKYLGHPSFHWYSLYYGAGGLNQKACFEDLKTNISYIDSPDKYDTLPKFGVSDRISTGTREKGFIIQDTEDNKANYDYINTDAEGNTSLNLNQLIAQMSMCIQDLNERIKTLKNQINILQNK
jgi:hypothetical protein